MIDRMKYLILTLLALTVGVLSPRAEAQQAVNANAVYNGWIAAYQVPDGSNFFLAKSLQDRTAGFWSSGYLITEAEDAYFQNRSASRYTQITQLLNEFLKTNGSDWSSDTWDDDLEWIILAFVRGYEITGDTTYLSAAEKNWNAVYSRGWDSTFGGGLWEHGVGSSKCVLSNAPFVIEGVELYRATGGSTYLSESEQVYAWERANLFNYTNSTNANGAPGQAGECIHSSGLDVSDNIYNMGLIVNAANSLYRVTQNSEYSSDLQLAASHVMSKWPILNADYPANGYFSADHLIRGLAAYATQNNAWGTYGTYLHNNASASWNERWTTDNISWNKWTSPTSTSNDLYSMESGASVTIQAVMPTQFNLAGTYEIQNSNSGLVLNVKGNSTASGAIIQQSPYASGATNELWTFVPTAGGYYQIKSVSSGLVLNVTSASTQSGALIVQWAAQGMQPGNDQWLPAQNTDGTFSFYNLNSNMALEVPGGSKSSGTQLDQSFAANTAQQKFNLIQPSINLAGTFEIANTNSGLALNVAGASKTEGAIVEQYPFTSGQNNSLWTFVAAQPGYYRIQNVNSGLDVNVTAASLDNGALLVQWPAIGTAPYNDQWRPVKNADGSYSFYNSNSSQAIDVPNDSKASGLQLDQWPDNGTTAQSFNLISH